MNIENNLDKNEYDLYNTGKFGLSQKALKIIAIVAMFIDHYAWKFVEYETQRGQVMHFIGRLTMPIMCFFITEGFYRTRNVWKYFSRLMIFALISHFPFQYFLWGEIPLLHPNQKNYYLPMAFVYTSVIYTLAMGLLALIIIKKLKVDYLTKIVLLVGIYYLTKYCDYGIYGVLWVLCFGLFMGNRFAQCTSFIAVTIYYITRSPITYLRWAPLGAFIPLILIMLYDGSKGSKPHLKWIFYIFYPLHLLILALIKFNFKI